MRKGLARVVSRVFDPVWEIPIAIFLAIMFAVKEGLRGRFLGLILFIDAVVPSIFFLTMLYHKQISNWDIDKRGQRLPLYIFTLVCHLGGLWLAHELGKSDLTAVLLVFYLVGIVFVGVTFLWKISIHAGVNAVLFTAINVFYGGRYWYLYLLLFLVMWARVEERHHTWRQVGGGAIVASVITYLGLKLIGL